ncbi:MAG: NAD(P)H-dependent flavin oxidoreductase [Microthrixaceae bacterium]
MRETTSDTTPASPRLVTSLTTRLGIRHPILLAPMGDSAGGRLAAAVSRAGGLGLLGGGYGDPAWMERELELAGDARIGVGFITFALERARDALTLALESKPVAVQLSFGDPRPFVEDIRAAGAALICQVQTRDEVATAVAVGADVIVAQGRDAGGHGRPDRSTMALVPSVVDQAGDVPVVAAGGIADGRGLAAALLLGATGVTFGTRFLASQEAITTPGELRLLVERSGDDTVSTEALDVVRGPAWPTGHDGRALRNELIDGFEQTDDPPDLGQLRRRYASSDEQDHAVRPVWAGEALGLITEITPAASIIEATVADAADRLRSAGAYVVA